MLQQLLLLHDGGQLMVWKQIGQAVIQPLEGQGVTLGPFEDGFRVNTRVARSVQLVATIVGYGNTFCSFEDFSSVMTDVNQGWQTGRTRITNSIHQYLLKVMKLLSVKIPRPHLLNHVLEREHCSQDIVKYHTCQM